MLQVNHYGSHHWYPPVKIQPGDLWNAVSTLEVFETFPEPLEIDELKGAWGTYEERKMYEVVEMVLMDFRQAKVKFNNWTEIK